MSRPWRVDVLLGLVGVALGLTNGLLGWADSGDVPVAVGLATAAGVILAGVRRWPWPVLLVECVLLVVTDRLAPTNSGIAQIGLAIGLAVVAYHERWPGTGLAFVLSFAATLVDVIDPGTQQLLLGRQAVVRVLAIAALVAAPIAFGRYLRGQRRAAQVAEERAREMEARRAVETRAARLAERTSIARDLHDIVAHHVSAIALRAGSAQYAARHTGGVDEAVQALGELRATAGRALDELRELLEVLRDPEAVESDAVLVEPEQVLGEAVQRIRAAGMTVRLDVAEPVATAPLVVRTTAARLVQEGLTNSLKHAGAGATVSVRLHTDRGALLVEVLDSGSERAQPGRSALPPSGHGLAGMRERVDLLGGRMTAGPNGVGGWRLAARLPIREHP